MDCAIIKKASGAIDPLHWQRIIATHPALEPFPDREVTNPFTQEKIFAPGDGKAYYVEGGNAVGNLALNENGEIAATGVPPATCSELAALLGAVAHEADFS